MTHNKIEDQSGDRKYFIVTPQLVHAKSRDPFDFTLWNTVKMVAGDEGECFLSTQDLADLSMMSAGKVQDCRRYLLDCGLLKGELTRDPGQFNEVWHLKIPDLWEANIKWRQENDSLKKRIKAKREQREQLKDWRKKARSSDEQGKAHSPGEQPPPPGEQPPPPGELKKNQPKTKKEEPAPPPKSEILPLILQLKKLVGYTDDIYLTDDAVSELSETTKWLYEINATIDDLAHFQKWWSGWAKSPPTLRQVKKKWTEAMAAQATNDKPITVPPTLTASQREAFKQIHNS